MRVTICSVLCLALSTLTAICQGQAQITAAPRPQYNDLLRRKAATTASDRCGSSTVSTIPVRITMGYHLPMALYKEGLQMEMSLFPQPVLTSTLTVG